MQPTSPLRDNLDIDSSIEKFLSLNGKSLISVKKINNKYLKLFYKKDNIHMESLFNSKFISNTRQDLPETFLPNGAIYIMGIEDFQKTQKFEIKDETLFFIMNKLKSIDIDSLSDFRKAEKYLKNI